LYPLDSGGGVGKGDLVFAGRTASLLMAAGDKVLVGNSRAIYEGNR